jgi:hypothetical protein
MRTFLIDFEDARDLIDRCILIAATKPNPDRFFELVLKSVLCTNSLDISSREMFKMLFDDNFLDGHFDRALYDRIYTTVLSRVTDHFPNYTTTYRGYCALYKDIIPKNQYATIHLSEPTYHRVSRCDGHGRVPAFLRPFPRGLVSHD